MTLTINKLAAAESQLKEAIRLFFEERDPVSIHTLASAALQIFHDYFDDEDIRKHQLLFHPKYIANKNVVTELRAAANFFKHGEKHANAEILFNPRDSEFDIAHTIRCIGKIKTPNYAENIPEFYAFNVWFDIQTIAQNPHLTLKKHELYEIFKDRKKADYLEMIEILRNNSEIVDSMEVS